MKGLYLQPIKNPQLDLIFLNKNVTNKGEAVLISISNLRRLHFVLYKVLVSITRLLRR